MTPVNNFQTLNVYYLGGKDEVESTDDSFETIMEEIEFEIPSDVDLDAETFSDVQLGNH